MPLKICHLIDTHQDTSFFRSIARQHDRERFPVMIGSIAPAGPLQEAMRGLGVPTFSLNATARWQYPAAIWRLVRLLRRERATVLHTHCFDPTCIGLVAARLAGVAFVFTRHHSDHHIRINKRWHTLIDSWCGRLADRVIAVSQVTRRIMIEIEHVPASQITVVYNGMESLPLPKPEDVESVKQELGLNGEPVCLMLGRLHEEKGHRYLFEALPEVRARVGTVKVLLAGDGPHQGELEAEVRARGLSDIVSFLGQRNDVPELIKLSSLVVLPSLAESFGYAVLEAMSLGKPVVAAATGGIPEVVAAGETGLLVPTADSQALASAMCQVLQDSALARSLGESGQKRAELFTFDRMITGYEAVYSQVSLKNQDYHSEAGAGATI